MLAPAALRVGKSLWQHGSLQAAYAAINREMVNRFLSENIDAHEAVLDDIARDTEALKARYEEDTRQLNEEIVKLTRQLEGSLNTSPDLATEKYRAQTSLATARALLTHISGQIAALDTALTNTIPQERATIADRRAVQAQLQGAVGTIERIRSRVQSSVTRIDGIEENVARLDEQQVDLLGRLEDIAGQNRDALAQSSADFEAETGRAPLRVTRNAETAEPSTEAHESNRNRGLRAKRAEQAQGGGS